MAQTPPPGTPPGKTKEPVPYRNPFRGVRGLLPERVDMGVDYGGTGPVYALGPGVITYASTVNTGWGPPAGPAPGGYIKERITAGPLAGHEIYVAEGIQPTVQAGQRVTSATQIGQMVGGIETGFAGPGTSTLAAELGQQMPGGDPGGWPSAAGVAYNRVLMAVGTPSGTGVGATVTGHGSNPSWLDKLLSGVGGWLGGPGGGVVGVGAGAAGGIAGAITGLADWLHGLDTAVAWLVNPSNWIRILAGMTGGVMVLGGLVVLSGVQARASQAVPVVGGAAASVQTSMRLPVGMLMVGGGGVLLFVAFHNLPSGVINLNTLLGFEGQQLQGAVSGQSAGAGP